ncbi:uncharacterized protein LOC120536705 isoform X2 [Polypterus senegalus]|uniref:uncharacterized protein LOC120536705 isoform X2 n=1 Tax=Polypterus senegalus TaxID=55291 RepID=UPI0019642836|nr:uncharacterized protein LOC120536705 isoform X2 [Polypterus senegalus]
MAEKNTKCCYLLTLAGRLKLNKQSVEEGETVVFRCFGSLGNTNIMSGGHFLLYRNGQPFRKMERTAINEIGILTLERITKTYEGMYSCAHEKENPQNLKFIHDSSSVILEVKESVDSLHLTATKRSSDQGVSVTFTCLVSINARQNIKFSRKGHFELLKNGKVIDSVKDKIVFAATFDLKNVSETEQADYVCVYKDGELSIKSKPISFQARGETMSSTDTNMTEVSDQEGEMLRNAILIPLALTAVVVLAFLAIGFGVYFKNKAGAARTENEAHSISTMVGSSSEEKAVYSVLQNKREKRKSLPESEHSTVVYSEVQIKSKICTTST